MKKASDFDKPAFDRCDTKAKKALLEYISRKYGVESFEGTQFGVDIVAPRDPRIPFQSAEVEIKEKWFSSPWKQEWRTVHIAKRKSAVKTGNTWYFVFPVDCSSCVIVHERELIPDRLINISTSRGQDDFFDVPLELCEVIKMEDFIAPAASIYTNPYPLGSRNAQDETKKQIMLALMGNIDYDEGEKEDMRIMWKRVLAGEALIADYRALAHREAVAILPEMPAKIYTTDDFMF